MKNGPLCGRCRPGEAAQWFVSSPAYSHSAGELAHYCTSGRRIAVGVDELEGEEREWAEALVRDSSAASRRNAEAYR